MLASAAELRLLHALARAALTGRAAHVRCRGAGTHAEALTIDVLSLAFDGYR